MTKIEKHKQICELLNDTYKQKNHDYGDSFGKSYRDLGLISAITRISDKFNRLVSLGVKNNSQEVKDESLEDTLLDMANYCIMTVIEMDEENEKTEAKYEDCPYCAFRDEDYNIRPCSECSLNYTSWFKPKQQ